MPAAEPERLKARPHHGRFPIPFTTHVRPDGRPDFRVQDMDRRAEVGNRRLCQLCGQALEPRVVFLGFARSITRRVFGEGPMHRDCMEWAWEVCPFLAGGTYRDLSAEEQDLLVIAQPSSGPRHMGVYVTDDFAMVLDDEGAGVKYLAPAAIEPVQWRSRVL